MPEFASEALNAYVVAVGFKQLFLCACQAVESAWLSTKVGSLLPLRLVSIKDALRTMEMTSKLPRAQAHHVVSAVIFSLCLPKEPRCRIFGPLLHSLRLHNQ